MLSFVLSGVKGGAGALPVPVHVWCGAVWRVVGALAVCGLTEQPQRREGHRDIPTLQGWGALLIVVVFETVTGTCGRWYLAYCYRRPDSGRRSR